MKGICLTGAALCLLLGLFTALPAAAFPPQCEVSCSCTAKCTTVCADGGLVTNCLHWGECIGHCGAVAIASTTGASLDLPAFLAPAACTDLPAQQATATPAAPTE